MQADIVLLSKAVELIRQETNTRLHLSTVFRAGKAGRIQLYKAGGKLAVSISQLRAKYGVQVVR